MRLPLGRIFLLWLGPFIACLFGIVGCGGENSSDSLERARTAPVRLVHNDLRDLQSTEDTGGSRFDAEYNGTFSEVFEGTRGDDVKRYFDRRIHYLAADTSDVEINPSHFRYQSWTEDPAGPSGSLAAERTKVELGAANIGTGLWLMGLINEVRVTLTLDGEPIPIQSSRTGIMFIGPGYEETVQVRGDLIALPPAFRQAILIHEARHSDCTGGVTDDALKIARAAQNQREFTETFPDRACGHLHIYCPPHHELAGLPACDGEPWGAYSLGALYARAATLRAGLSRLDWEILNASAIDSASRVIGVDVKKMFAGEDGPPDMSSSGLRP